jgi:flavodoxin
MKALILYDSVFGNTGKISQVMHEELQTICESKLKSVDSFSIADLNSLELIVVGSPTRAFTMTPKMKTLLKSLPKEKMKGIRYLTFDSRMNVAEVDNKFLTFMAGTFGYASEKIAKMLHKKDCRAAGNSEVFYVKESEGPLLDGELEKARKWIRQYVK